jgi:UDP-glucose 4-epimerase
MTVLITGVAGLIGSRFAEWILRTQPGVQVVGMDNLSGGYLENVPKGVNFYNVDLVRDHAAVSEIISDCKVDVIYHLAAYAAEGLSPFIRRFNYETNVIASVNLINAAIQRGVDKFIFTSSMAVYGNGQTPPFSEETPPSPIDPYGIAKYAVEMDLEIARIQHGLRYTVIRPHNFYGVNQNIWDRYRNVLGIWMYQLMKDEPMTIYGDGEQTRAFSFVDDAMVPLWRAQDPECDGHTINLGGIHEHSINQACEALIRVTGTRIRPIHLPPRHEAKHAWTTWQKSVDMLGFKHEVELEDGLGRMWEWAQRQPERPRKAWESFEIDRGVYSYWRKK